jgi:hypothetical protein
MSAIDRKEHLIKKYNLKTSDYAMTVSVQLFDSLEDYDEWNTTSPEDRNFVPDEFSFLVINDRTTTSE